MIKYLITRSLDELFSLRENTRQRFWQKISLCGL